jgi:hypothetical protein
VSGVGRRQRGEAEVGEGHHVLPRPPGEGLPRRGQRVPAGFGGAAVVPGLGEVVGQRGQAGLGIAGKGGQRPADVVVEPGPPGGRQRGVDRVADKGVGELVVAGAQLDDHGRRDGLVQGVEGGVGVAAVGDGLHEAEIELEADDRGDGQGPVGRVGQPGQPAGQDVTDPLGHPQSLGVVVVAPAAGLLVCGAGLGQVAHELADEERISRGAGVKAAGQGHATHVQRPAFTVLEERGHAVLVEALQQDALDPGLTAEVGQGAGEGVLRCDLGVPVGSDDHEPGDRGRQQVAEHGERRRGGPVEVVEDQDDGPPPGCVPEQGPDGFEQSVAVTGRP